MSLYSNCVSKIFIAVTKVLEKDNLDQNGLGGFMVSEVSSHDKLESSLEVPVERENILEEGHVGKKCSLHGGQKSEKEGKSQKKESGTCEILLGYICCDPLPPTEIPS